MKNFFNPLYHVMLAAMGGFSCPAKLRFGKARLSQSITGEMQQPPNRRQEEAAGYLLLITAALLMQFSRLQTCVCLKWQTTTWRGG